MMGLAFIGWSHVMASMPVGVYSFIMGTVSYRLGDQGYWTQGQHWFSEDAGM